MKRVILAGWLATNLWLGAAPADALLDRMITRPGSYAQVCDVMMAPQDVPYRAFELTDFAGASFSKTNQSEISQNREALVKAIRERLLAIDFTKPAKPPTEDPKPEENQDGDAFGCDPQTLNPLLLELILRLQATEALPELLAVEAKLVKGIAQAKNDAKAAPPEVAGWFVGMQGPYDENEVDQERKGRLFVSRVAQRDLVMLMAVLLREKKYAPYLKTGIEAAYAKGLRALAKKDGLEKFKPGEPLPEELEHMEIEIDPVTQIPRRKHSPVLIPYTRESRDEVRAAAEKWIAAHP